ncbi:hypothetical protein ACFLZG_00880 [Thermodesulfobacteriota bacterium]
MKNHILLPLFLFLFIPSFSSAEDFLGAPIIPQGITVQRTDTSLEIKAKLTHDEAIKFYKEALKGYADIKYREWKDATYIEDDGKLEWHSITISKGDKETTTIIIAKDSWTWIIGTLILRYIGVFVVLLVLFLGMSASGKIISNTIKKMEAKKTGAS